MQPLAWRHRCHTHKKREYLAAVPPQPHHTSDTRQHVSAKQRRSVCPNTDVNPLHPQGVEPEMSQLPSHLSGLRAMLWASYLHSSHFITSGFRKCLKISFKWVSLSFTKGVFVFVWHAIKGHLKSPHLFSFHSPEHQISPHHSRQCLVPL